MRMLCIRGRTHPVHTGLFSGRVYEVDIVRTCGCTTDPRAFAEGSVFHTPLMLRCTVCGDRRRYTYVPWGPERFVPWNDPKVTQDEVTKLYEPSKQPTEVS